MRASLICLQVLVIFASIHVGNSIKCYVCNSNSKEGGCENGAIDENHLTECSDESPKYTMCRKTRQTIKIKHGSMEPDERVIRDCSYEKQKRPCYRSVHGTTTVISCQCDSDGCNKANGITSNIFIPLAVFTILARYFFNA